MPSGTGFSLACQCLILASAALVVGLCAVQFRPGLHSPGGDLLGSQESEAHGRTSAAGARSSRCMGLSSAGAGGCAWSEDKVGCWYARAALERLGGLGRRWGLQLLAHAASPAGCACFAVGGIRAALTASCESEICAWLRSKLVITPWPRGYDRGRSPRRRTRCASRRGLLLWESPDNPRSFHDGRPTLHGSTGRGDARTKPRPTHLPRPPCRHPLQGAPDSARQSGRAFHHAANT